MAGVAKLTIIGNLGRDPETAILPSGRTRLSFSVAVNRKRQQEELTDWYAVSVFGALADTLDGLVTQGALVKGRQVYVDGRLEPRVYADRNGKERTSLDLFAETVQLLGGRGDGNDGGEAGSDVPF